MMPTRAALTAVAITVAAVSRAGAQSASDSTLASACASGDGIAEGLLVVEFRPDVAADRRAALAKEAGGTLAGPVPDGRPAGDYVAVPGAAGAALDAAADRLIRLDGVQSVGGVTCPPPPSPAAADSSRADSAGRAAAPARASGAVPQADSPADSARLTTPVDSAAGPSPDTGAVSPPAGP
ncbi:MAG TPA: hypothetical protein VFT84_10090 [Gemmatimonadales bacterium]|nr:hypothetical protein [Gemmatimonadales bacterium]